MKKNSLLITMLIILLSVMVISWFIPAGYYQDGYVNNGFIRLGFFDFWQYAVLPFFQSVFIEVLIFILAVGAFYGVLVKTGAYKKSTENLAKKFKKKGILALSIIAFIFAALSSFGGYGLLLFVFIPAIITIVLLMGYDKFTALLVTFGAMLIGTIGTTFGANTISSTISTLATTYTANIWFKLALFVLSFAVFLLFTIRHANKTKTKDAKKETKEIKDTFAGEELATKKDGWGIAIIFWLIFVMIILGCTKWNEVFGIEFFSKLHTAITNFAIGDYKIFSYILGTSAYELGTWSYFQISIILILASLLIGGIYGQKFSERLKNMINGLSKVLKEALLITFAYSILIIIVNSGVFLTLMSYLLEGSKKFNIFVSGLIMTTGSVLHVELPYFSSYALVYMAKFYASGIGVSMMNVMSQSIYGTIMLVAPTSVLLILGLTYLDIPYKNWLKFIWKLVIELFIIVIIVLIVMMLIVK